MCNCGAKLRGYEVARGTCNKCHMVAETALLRRVTEPKEHVVSQPTVGVVSQDRRKKWVANHPDQRRLIHREGQRRRRA